MANQSVILPHTSQPLFKRACELVIGQKPPDNNFVAVVPDALKITGLRVVFRVEKDGTKDPNTAKINVYNLSQASRAQLQQKGVRVILSAGYDGTISQIFSGDARTCSHGRTGPNWVTEAKCGDGERAIKFARVNESFAPGATVKDVLGKAIKALQVDPGNALQQAQKITTQYSSGYATNSLAAVEIDRQLAPAGYSWSIQDGRIEILKPDEVLKEQGPLLTPDTGLIGAPEWGTPDKKGKPSILKCRSLLQPRFRPGLKFELRSDGIQGFFRVGKVIHLGDTDGGDWYSDLECTQA